MQLSSPPWLILASFIVIVLVILGLIVRYLSSSQYYLDIEPRKLSEYHEKYRYYLLGMGLYTPLTEFILHYFKIRENSELVANVAFGIIALTLYYISDKINYIKQNLYILFIVLFNFYSILVFEIVLQNPGDYLVVSEFTLLIMFSFLVYTRMLQFITYNAVVLCFLFTAHLLNGIEFNHLVVYCNIINLAFALNFANYFIHRRLNKSLHLSHTIANTGPMFTLGIDYQGNIEFVSQNAHQVLGLHRNFNLKGKSIEIILGNSLEDLKSKLDTLQQIIYRVELTEGDEKIIQIQKLLFDEKNYFISCIDITSNIQLKSALELQRNRFESILTHTSDLVFVFNGDLICTDIFNRNYLELTHLPEFYIGKHLREIGYSKIAYNRIFAKVQEALETNTSSNTEYTIQTPNGKQWYDLRIYSIKGLDQKTAEIVFVSRNITSIKVADAEQKIIEENIKKQHLFLLDLSLQRISTIDSEDAYFSNIATQLAEILGITRVGVWFYKNNGIDCKVLIDRGTVSIPKDYFLSEKEFPVYFNTIKNDLVIRADNAKTHPHTFEFGDSYFEEHNIKSMMDVPIRYQGELYAIICCEQTEVIKNWSEQDANFIKQVADILAAEFSEFKRRLAEKELEHTRKILSQSSQIAKLGAWEFKPKTQQFTLSELGKSLMQLTPNENYTLQSIEQKLVFEDDKKTLKQSFKLAIEQGKSFDIQTLVNLNEVEPKWIRIIGKPDLLDDQCTCICGAFQDIDEQVKAQTALVESERHFQYITDTIKDVFWLYDIDQKKVLYINPSCKDLFNHSPEEFYQDAVLWKTYTHPDDIQLVSNAHQRLFEEDFFELEYRIIIQNEIKWIHEKSFAIKDDTGRIVKNSGINIDITAQRMLSEQISHNKALEIENQAKALFLANMSHEIRTPLNGIIGLTDLLRDTQLTAQQADYLINIYDSAHLLHDIINNILDYTKINSGNVQLLHDQICLINLCEKIKHVFSFQAKQKGLKFEVVIDKNIPTHLSIDDIRLKQVLLNLLGNAVKFTEHGHIGLNIEKMEDSSKSTIVRFSIHDSGIGIHPQNLNKIFNAFTQEDSSTTKRFGGTGLGLSISAKIVHLMGSKIHVKSDIGKGSVFYFDLPIDLFSSPAIPPSNSSALPREIKNTFSQDKITFLLVEDNKVNMFLLKAILHDLLPNCQCNEAENGLQALEYMHGQPDVQLIFMDLQMPVMNGYEAAAAIRKLPNTEHIPILAITAGSVETEREMALQAGMSDFLTKPIVASTISAALRKWLPMTSQDDFAKSSFTKAAIDLDRLQQANQQNSIYLKSIFPYIKESLVDGLKELKEHLQSKDYKSVSIVAHRIKGTALTAAFSKLTNLTLQLEKHDFTQEKIAEDLVAQIEAEIKLILPLL